tara:strand:- start:444 stop:1091 length:648 start_codon:yes stop_codon:yes gene_type:complete
VCCGKIPIKRYFLPIVFVPIVLIVYKELQNYVYIPVFLGISAFVLFWNFPWIVYYTASKPLYYQDLFIDEKKLPNYDVNPKLKSKFQNILIWVLIVSNSLLVAALGDYWLYSAIGLDATFEILGVTGGIIKIFQIINNTISRIMLKILKIFIRKENKRMRRLEIEKMRKLVKCNFNSTNQLKNNDFVSDEKKEDKSVEMVFNNDLKPYRDRLQTI